MAAQETIIVAVVYEDGIFRPLEPLDLPEHTHGNVTFELAENTFEAEDKRIRALFAAAGEPLVPRPPQDGRRPMTAQERAEFAQGIGPGRSIAEIIDEEREGI